MINQDRLVKTFLELVQIDSPSGEEKAIAQHVAEKLKTLGAAVEFDTYGNVIGKIPGQGEVLMINAHLDTVEPGKGIKPVIKGDKITTDGSTVLGGDPKAGVAAILETLTSLKEDTKAHLPLEIVFTLEEETSLGGSINLDYTKVLAKKVVTFDGEAGVKNITVSAPGYNKVDITITGRSAHAGAEPEKGLSAIKIAADMISKLQVGRIDFETTANIGIINGGSARNAVPDTVTIQAEIRSRNEEKLEKHTDHFKAVFKEITKQYPTAKIDVSIIREFNPYVLPPTNELVVHVANKLKSLGITPVMEDSGGATDVNIFHTHGIQGVCVGTGDYEAHTTREYVLISEMVETTKFCEALLTVE